MLFNSFEFFVFLAAVLTAYWVLHPRRSMQNTLLVLASYVFYGWWDYRFLSLIVVSTVADFTIAQRLHRHDAAGPRRRWLAASLLVNLGILGAFKYFNFFVDSAASLFESIGWAADTPTLTVVLPVGISFYTFQTISYTFDVFRHRIGPERNIVTFAVYVAFFPQLVAGPIERARHLLPQIQAERVVPGLDRIWSGGWLILTGLFKKVVLADGLAAVVETRFSSPGQHGSISLLVGVYAFAIQIYGDFSGYSSMARGVARLFGIELIRNFEQPYLSANISQFWRTWHISLSTWLWDYLYVPLGGNRRGRRRTYINLFLAMLIGGLWHGAAWTFVVWGGLHGLYLAAHRALGAYEARGRPRPPGLRDLGKVVFTFHLVAFTWIFFRAETFSGAWDYFTGFGRLTSSAAGDGGSLSSQLASVTAFMVAAVALDWIDRNRARYRPLTAWNPLPLGVAVGVMIAGLLVFSGGTLVPFIYFQF